MVRSVSGYMKQNREKVKTGVRGLIALVLALWVSSAHPQAPALEYQVKASYVYNFMQFVTWPSDVFDAERKFRFCVVGAERLGSALDALAGERLEGREIVIHRLEQGADAHAVRCHLLFVTDSEAPYPGIARGMLTIGEAPGFLGRDGMINFVAIQGRIRFEINQSAAQKAGLVVSSRLLSLAVSSR